MATNIFGAWVPYEAVGQLLNTMTIVESLHMERLRIAETRQSESVKGNADETDLEFDEFTDEELIALEAIMNDDEEKYITKTGTKVMCLDIEAIPRDGKFPESYKDPVLQISSVCATLLPHGRSKVENYIFTLGTCLPINDAIVVECINEYQLLSRWRDLVMKFDPDVLSGYYFTHFDLRYMIERAEKLKAAQFAYFGRKSNKKVRVVRSQSQPYVNEVPGRQLVDLCTFIREEYKSLPSYKLNEVSKLFLGKEKDDVDYNEMPYLQRTSAATRQKLAKYCLKDSVLVLDLFQKLNCLSKLQSVKSSSSRATKKKSSSGTKKKNHVPAKKTNMRGKRSSAIPVN